MAEIAYNNAKHTSTSYTSFQLNCEYQPRISYENDVDNRLESKAVDELTKKLKNLMAIYRENLQYA